MSVVYFIQVEPFGPIKIGTTKGNVAIRMRALQQTSPHILKWIGCFAGDQKDELTAHDQLKNSRARGEWFYPTKEVLDFVEMKSPNFSEENILNQIFREGERRKVRAALPAWDRGRCSARAFISDRSGMGVYDLEKWLQCRRAPDPVMAIKAAQAADELISGASP